MLFYKYIYQKMKTKEDLLSIAGDILNMIDSYSNLDHIDDLEEVKHYIAQYLRREWDEELWEYISDE